MGAERNGNSLAELERRLSNAADQLWASPDLLMPKLISGALDVSKLDLETA
jgi:hypothetical protein